MELAVPPENPWFTIRTDPRETIREVVNFNPAYIAVPIMIMAGISRALIGGISLKSGDGFGAFNALVGLLVFGPLVSISILFIGGAVLTVAGRLLGGRGTFVQLRAAIAWSEVPQIIPLFIALLVIALLCDEALTSQTSIFAARIGEAPILANISIVLGSFIPLIMIGVALWSFFILISGIAEIHQFSTLHALSTLFIPGLLLSIFGILFYSYIY